LVLVLKQKLPRSCRTRFELVNLKGVLHLAAGSSADISAANDGLFEAQAIGTSAEDEEMKKTRC